MSVAIRRRILVAELRYTQVASSASELATNFGVSSRTIERDIAELRSSGMEIRASNGRNGGVSVGKTSSKADSNADANVDLSSHIAAEIGKLDKTGVVPQSLLLAAAIGPVFDISLIKSAAHSIKTANGQKLSHTVDQSLEILVISGILVTNLDQQFIRFVTESVRLEILRSANPDELKLVHLALGIELERRYRNDPSSAARRIALHLIQAGSPDTIDRAIKYALIAGNRCIDDNDYLEAIQWFRWIVELHTTSPTGESVLAAKIGLAKALNATSQRSGIAEAASLIRDVVNHYDSLGDRETAVVVALTEIQPISGDTQSPTDIAGMLEVVLNYQEAGQRDRGYLLAYYSQALLTERNDYAGAVAAAESSMDISKVFVDERLRMKADQARLVLDAKLGKIESAIGLADSIITRAISAEDIQIELQSRFHLVTNLTLIGRVQAATTAADEMLSRSSQFKVETRLEQSLGILASLDMIQGNFGSALERAGRARRQFGGTSWTVLPAVLTGVYDGIRSGFISEPPEGTHNKISRWRLDFEMSFLEFSLGNSDPTPIQLQNLRRLIQDFDNSGGAQNSLAIRLAVEPLLDAYEGDTANVTKWLQSKSEFARIIVGFSGVPVSSIMGLAAARIGQLDLANSYFDTAIELSRKSGAAPQLACALINQAQLGNTSAKEWADSPSLVEAREIVERIGIAPLARRIGAVEDSYDGAPPDRDDPLTKRERDVLVLIARGRTTREIGELLFITESTVTRHTTNILEKIDARNRV